MGRDLVFSTNDCLFPDFFNFCSCDKLFHLIIGYKFELRKHLDDVLLELLFIHV
jgi:hypothetical protein